MAKPSRLRTSVICVDQDKLLVVRFKDPVTNRIYLFPPGGQIEKGETPAQAGIRETLEETGYSVAIDQGTEFILRYDFQWGDKVFDCTTYCYSARLLSQTTSAAQFEAYQLAVEWLPLSEVDAAFAYHDAILTAVKRLLP